MLFAALYFYSAHPIDVPAACPRDRGLGVVSGPPVLDTVAGLAGHYPAGPPVRPDPADPCVSVAQQPRVAAREGQGCEAGGLFADLSPRGSQGNEFGCFPSSRVLFAWGLDPAPAPAPALGACLAVDEKRQEVRMHSVAAVERD